MPAPDFETIYRFEETIEAAFVSVLTPAGVNAFTQREVSQITTPYALLQLQMGGTTEHYAAVQGDFRPDVWNATMQIQLVTDRTNNNADHAVFRSKIRKTMAKDSNFKDAILLPYHEVFWCLESGTSPTIQSENDLDVSTLSYSVKFGIRAGAWPA